jgi:uncharacterized membrane protein
MDLVYLLLRLLHILAAVFWISTALVMVLYVEPAVRATGKSGEPVMQAIMQRGLPIAGNVAALVAVIAGAMLYGRDFGRGGNPLASGNPTVLAFTLGALAAILALVLSWAVAAPAGRSLGKLGSEIRAQAQPPSPELLRQMGSLRGRLTVFSWVNLALLTVALALMAVARAL